MASAGWALLLFLAHLLTLDTNGVPANGNITHHSAPIQCRPDQAKALLKLKQSLFFDDSTTTLPSWQVGTDCCHWEGVGCSNSTGHVTVLALGGRGFYSRGLNPAVFNLTSLRMLDLSENGFDRYSMPNVGFEKLALLSHLNLSNSGFVGEIPAGIGQLVNLISLDLSNRYDTFSDDMFIDDYYNSLSVSNFHTIVRNLSNLRELYLDEVDIGSSGEEWCNALAKSVPHLQVLSLESCDLYGSIHQSLSSLSSITVINLQYNNGISAGLFPEFFMDFVNLSVLQLADTNLEGLFPRRTFQSKNLRVLDLSWNMNLSGNLPNFSNASSLETLRLDGTNFKYSKPNSSSNFRSLKELSLDGKFISMEFLSRLGLQRELRSIFSWIGGLRNLKSLELDECDLSSTTPSSIANLKSLRSLSIFGCNLTMPVLSAIGNLKGLQDLLISDCRLNGSMPSTIGNLTNLRSLCINSCEFLGPMPPTIGFLGNLQTLVISDCMFAGPIPSTIGNLSNLKGMVIHGCEFPGPIPYAVGQLNKLRTLRLRESSFTGGIPNSIGNLTCLLELVLSMNYISGEIPTSLFTLPMLQDLDLSWNQLSGPIQEFDVASSCLMLVDLSMNELTGQIPRSFFELTNLRRLDIGWNNLVGSVNLTSFWRLSKLRGLVLSNNKFSVMDGEGNNSSLTHLSRLTELRLACCNITKFPSILPRLDDVSDLDLSSNKLSGDIPNWIWERWNSSLQYLKLSHNMLTGMQFNSSVLPFKFPLLTLDLSFNGLQGQIPMPNASAQVLDYSNNNFSLVLPNFTLYLSDTYALKMSNNSINGYIPDSVCNSMLQVLDLSYNNLSGPIPSCLIENVELRVLNLRENQFEGTLPSNITSECALQTIDLHGNMIEGQLPRALSNCSQLEVLDIGNNLIIDVFPSWLKGLSNLYVLILRSNLFYGSIGDIFGHHQSKECFSNLQIIDLASNNFFGNLSSEWFACLKSMMAEFNSTGDIVRAQYFSGPTEQFYQDSTEISYKGLFVSFERILTTLTAIDFSNNRLEGTIPESIGRLVSLRVLNMSHNAFTEQIPAELGSMTELESLDLSGNRLSWEIPQDLTNLTFLSTLNLSDNYLVGMIPQSRQFSTFDNSSFQGNAGLCGRPLSIPCGVSPYTPSEAHADRSSKHVDVVLFLFVGLGFGVGFAAAILMRWGPLGKWFVKSARSLRT